MYPGSSSPYSSLGSYGVDTSSLMGGYGVPNLNSPGGYAGAMTQQQNMLSGNLAVGNQTGDPTWLQKMLGWTSPDGTVNNGWGGYALGGAQAALGAYLGFQQLGLAKDQLKEGRRRFDLQFNNQSRLINSQLADRQSSRIAAKGGEAHNYQSVGDYMGNYRQEMA